MPVKSSSQIRPRSYWRAIINIIINPSLIPFYFRQFKLVYNYKGRLKLKKYSVRLPLSNDLHIEKNASLSFDDKCYLSNGARICVLESSEVNIGKNLFMNRNSSIVSRYGVKIGDDCMIAESVFIYDHDHGFKDSTLPFNRQKFSGAPIVIGNNVWIGSHVLIGRGVCIGDNVVIGAGSIVVKNIPSNFVVKMERSLHVREI
jgi:acetyltransferase-like isoleucine patch superfamily enzyme